MKKFKILYIGLSIIWVVLVLTIFPLTGEGAILPTIITTILSSPVGIMIMLIFSHLPFENNGDLVTLSYVLLSLFLGYYQWKFLIIYFNKKIKISKLLWIF